MNAKLKFVQEVEKYNKMVNATKQQLMDDFCTDTAISPFQYMQIKEKIKVDLFKEMDVVAKETISSNFKIMKATNNNGTVTDFTANLMAVFTRRIDLFFDTQLDLIKLARVAEILYNVKIDEKSTERKDVEYAIEKIAEAKVVICEEFISALAKRIGGLEMTA